MAITVTLAANTDLPYLQVEDKVWCFGVITGGAGGTYATNGFDMVTAVKQRFGVTAVDAIFFGNGMSAAGNTGAGNYIPTGEAQGRFEHSTGKVKLFQIGRTGAPGAGAASATQASEVEAPNGAVITGMRMEFWAICRQ